MSYGRSFRTGLAKELITQDKEYFRLFTRLNADQTIGIQKSLKDQQVRINGEDVKRISDLAAQLPVIALHPDSHQLISAGPEYRRQFLDWGVFHVEHSFIYAWKDFRKALSQRNAALRSHQPDKYCALWNQPLIENTQIIEELRLRYLDSLTIMAKKHAEQLFPGSKVSLEYKRGWSDVMDYQQYLEAHLDKDKEKGYTQGGPHRADIRIRLDNQSTQTSISRGQQKKLVALLKLSQLALFVESSDKTCILLYDDLPAELDTENRSILLQLLSTMRVQLFISAIEANQVDVSAWSKGALFHVEHGIITQQNI